MSSNGSPVTIGIDIGGTSVRAAVIDHDGEILASLRDTTPHTERETEDILVNLITKLAATQTISAVGLAVAGFVSSDQQRVMFAPHLAWRDADVPARISARVHLPVMMDHDVNSAAWAEYQRGASAGARIALLIALGTGIGAGLIIDGEIYRGAYGVAPELGHLTVVPDGRPCPCGKRGCWERYCSGTALAETARDLMVTGDAPVLRQLSGNNPAAVTGTMVAIAATEGDPAALAAMDEHRSLAGGRAGPGHRRARSRGHRGRRGSGQRRGNVSATCGFGVRRVDHRRRAPPDAAGGTGQVRRSGRHHRRGPAGRRELAVAAVGVRVRPRRRRPTRRPPRWPAAARCR